MMKKLRIGIVWLLVLSLLGEGLVPVFAQDSDPLKTLFDGYRQAYNDYQGAVSSGASLLDVQAKLEAYQTAYQKYQQAIQSQKGPTTQPPAQESGVLTSTDEALTVTEGASPTTGTVTATGSAQPDPAKNASWFARTLAKVKLAITGVPGKQMPLWEKVLWTVGKSLVPALGVTLATALLAPLSPIAMIAGGIVVGAALGGIMTYAFEKRMNAKYREVPKEDAKIWRDVSVSAVVEAVMAPFNLATGGLFGMVGPTMGSAIYRVAMTQTALTFAGSAVSSGVGGAVKHLWATKVFHYPEKIAANEKRIDDVLNQHLQSGTPLTAAEEAELDKLRTEIDTMKGEDYSGQDFVKDMKRSALTSVIGGFVGSVVSDRVYTAQTGKWSDILSVKVFGSAAQGKAISSVISTIPTNFLSGAAGAQLEKHFVDGDIAAIKKEQGAYPKGSAPYQYYERVLAGLNEKKEAISPVKSGLDSMANNLAVRSAQLTVNALKYNCYDAPRARKQAIEELYRANDPDWKKANDLYQKYQGLSEGGPDIRKFRSVPAYIKARNEYQAKVETARRDWLTQCIKAEESQKLATNVSVRQEIEVRFDREARLNQMLEIGRIQGGMSHLNAMKTVLKERNPELANATDNEVTKLACQAIRQSYEDKYATCQTKVGNIEATFKKQQDYKAGKIQLSPEEAKVLSGQAAMISPSQYKAALVEAKVYELKAQNVRWTDIQKQMPNLLTQAEHQTLTQYGGNWGTVLAAECYANGLAKYKYDPNGGVKLASELKTSLGSIPGMVETGVVSDYRTRVNSAIVGTLIPADSQNQNAFEGYMQTFARSALTTGSSAMFDSVYGVTKEQLLNSFNRPR